MKCTKEKCDNFSITSKCGCIVVAEQDIQFCKILRKYIKENKPFEYPEIGSVWHLKSASPGRGIYPISGITGDGNIVCAESYYDLKKFYDIWEPVKTERG
ncbi:MAG: hypothetical protein U9Q21_02500 [Candidatus Auribacterota bacterium]|nr:hypothetical protein [Candidatus Auribacterota bacterium]